MKKQSIIIALLLALCMVFVFAGCGSCGSSGSGGSGDSGDSTPPEEVKGSDCFFDCPATGYGFDLPEGVEITKGYIYPHDYPNHYAAQQYLPDAHKDEIFYRPGDLGYEKEIKDHLDRLREAAGQERKYQDLNK